MYLSWDRKASRCVETAPIGSTGEQQSLRRRDVRSGDVQTPQPDQGQTMIEQKLPKETADRKLVKTITDARAKGDTLARDEKVKDGLESVRKRADDVFDELEEEDRKPPPL